MDECEEAVPEEEKDYWYGRNILKKRKFSHVLHIARFASYASTHEGEMPIDCLQTF